jgi:hypothetical protein
MCKILVKSAWGSDDPTKAAFPFLHANALAEAGHDVQIFLLGEAVSLMRAPVANAVVPVGWPPLAETLPATFESSPSTSEARARGPGGSSTAISKARTRRSPIRRSSWASSSGATRS